MLAGLAESGVSLLALAALIYFACEFFVNGIEWLGVKLKLSDTATGSVLAAFGTALPESAITLMAVTSRHTPHGAEVGIGAALGGPLVLATISYGVVGFVLWRCWQGLGRDGRQLRVDHRRLARDQAWFLLIFAAKVALGLFLFRYKPLLGWVFLAVYGAYVWSETRETRADDEPETALEALRLRPREADPAVFWPLLQCLLALLAITVASRLFVDRLAHLSAALSISPALLALLLSPIATELPETLNALIWVRQGKERLALANISGAMMVQATVPSAFGLFFTPWLFDTRMLWAAGLTATAVALLWLNFRNSTIDARKLAAVSAIYGVFVWVLWRGAAF